jgi:F0F1-type ATP synthase assembly protein I
MAQSDKGRGILATLIIVLASVFGGLWLDERFNTKPVFTLALLFAGIPVSVLVMLAVARRTLARLKDQAERESKNTQ